jgi:cytochrome P450
MGSATEIDLMDLDPFVGGGEHELFARLREEDPLHWNEEADGPGFWSLTRYEDIRWAGQENALFSNQQGTQIQSRRAEGEGAARSMINMDDPEHKAVRRLLTDHFTRKGAERNVGAQARAVVDDLLDRAVRAGECDWVETVSVPLPLRVFGRWLGVPEADLPQVLEWLNVIGGQEDPEFAVGPETMAATRDGLFAYFSELHEQRRRDPQDDLVSLLAHATIDGEPLSLENRLLPNYQLLAFAGNDTTRNLVSWGVDTFDRWPKEWERLRADPDGLIGTAIEELLRFASPVYCMRRTMTDGFERHGRRVQPGQKVVLWWAAANRDPESFPDADRFDVARTPNKHVAFGWGRHFCMGSHVARLETELLFTRIIERGISIEVLGDPERVRSNFFRGIKRLPVRVTQ